MFSEARARLFSLGLDKEKATCGTGQDEMSDGRKCFQQLLLQWVEHIQSIAKQIKKKKAAGNLNDKITADWTTITHHKGAQLLKTLWNYA